MDTARVCTTQLMPARHYLPHAPLSRSELPASDPLTPLNHPASNVPDAGFSLFTYGQTSILSPTKT
eukprot:11196468-Lingulodinium_polyedra.AAC.1